MLSRYSVSAFQQCVFIQHFVGRNATMMITVFGGSDGAVSGEGLKYVDKISYVSPDQFLASSFKYSPDTLLDQREYVVQTALPDIGVHTRLYSPHTYLVHLDKLKPDHNIYKVL